jgi:hypothetical protein
MAKLTAVATMPTAKEMRPPKNTRAMRSRPK